ncbi:MAG: ABC transporter permease, partial [Bacteroidetes bacterium]|nr:ABC transporter permease [Bacteroidota bacterium]
MKLPVRLALRYLVKRRTGTLVHLISSISVVVIAAVAAAMIAILSAFNGIEDLVQTLFGTLDAEVAILPQSGAVLPEELGDVLEGIPGVGAW